MSLQASGPDVERFRNAISAQIGLQFDDAKLGFLGEVLQRRLDKLGHSGDAYLRGLEHRPSSRELTALAQDLTIGETYFFRNHEQFRALAEVALPERMRLRQAPKLLRLLSAGCASGEEAYSLAIVARETIADPAWEVSIRAVDINPAALEKARRARYSAWALRETPLDIQQRWFREDGRELLLEDTVRAAVRFDNANLASDDPELWQVGAYDAIFCRNVLMYFAPEQMRAVIARIAQSLAPGGFLFLGHAETLRGVSDAFHLRHTHDTFYYEVKDRFELASRPPAQFIPRSVPPSPAITPLGAAWFDAIREATARVAALVPAPAPASVPAAARALPWDLAPALDLLRHERFAEALDHVRAGPPAADKDPDALLLEATLLAHSGQLVAAEDTCLRLLLIDELNAGAHYVLALCREHAGQRDRAREHDRVAAYLDPAFAMPRLHLGLLARRAGDREAARRELTQALNLLKREEASRLLLFGGGFGREALMSVCESALRECGARP
ncbi:MAG TPA: protein-glutamate O-methyltransferase CheR [Xanthobacteraceae bacterium]